MSEKSEKEEESIFKADTVPPPDGESDAYNAPTRVGATAPEVLAALKAAGVPAELLKGLEPPPRSEDQPSGERPIEKEQPAMEASASRVTAPSAPKVAATAAPRETDAIAERGPSPALSAAEPPAARPEDAQELGDADLEEVPRVYEPADDEAATELHKGSTWSQPPEVPMPSSRPFPPQPTAGSAWQILRSSGPPSARPPPSTRLRYAALGVLLLCFVVAIVASLGK
jgi:hypothetical protein